MTEVSANPVSCRDINVMYTATLPNHKPILPWSSSSYVLQLVFLRLRTRMGLGLSYFKKKLICLWSDMVSLDSTHQSHSCDVMLLEANVTSMTLHSHYHVLFGAECTVEKKRFQSLGKGRSRLCAFQYSQQLVPHSRCSCGKCLIRRFPVRPWDDIVSATSVPQWGPGWSGGDWLE